MPQQERQGKTVPAGWVAAGTALVGAAASQDSARHGANSQSDAANQANATLGQQSAQSRADNMPYMARGNAAGDQLNSMLGLSTGKNYAQAQADMIKLAKGEGAPDAWLPDNNSVLNFMQQSPDKYNTGSYDPNSGSLLRKFSNNDLANDPVYQSGLQFGLDQGTQGLNRQAAANGSLNSGATLKALTRFSNDYGSTKAADSSNRFMANQQQQYNMLAGVAGTGQVANAQVGTSGMNAANNISQNQIGAGNARAASGIAGSNALSGGLSGGYNMYQGNQLMGMLQNRNNPGSSYSAPSYGNNWSNSGYSDMSGGY